MSINKVRAYFKDLGIDQRILEFEKSSATVELAAEAAGVIPARICKTISFATPEGTCILVATAGDTKIQNSKFKGKFGFKAKMLSPEEVLAFTGYAVGGVCAFAIDNPKVSIYMDTSLKRFETVFPACGSSNSAIEMTCEEIFNYTKAKEWIDVCTVPEEVR